MRINCLRLVIFVVLIQGCWFDLACAGAKLKVDDDTFINIGAGIRVVFTGVEDGSPNSSSYSNDFDVQNSRIYISGQLMPKVKFTLNTEEIWGKYGVLDAIIQYEPSEAFNIWAGRMLTPADRIEMNGPFYGLSWNQYTVPLFPSDWSTSHDVAGAYGRDEGVTVWGKIDKFQYAVGVFDGYNGTQNKDDSLLFAGRIAYSFWNVEDNPAYYTSSTYYGKAGDVFTVGFSAQNQADGSAFVDINGKAKSGDFSAVSLDALMEKVLDNGNVVTLEGEYKSFRCECAPEVAAQPIFTLFDGQSYFATVAFMFAEKLGLGYVQPYVRHTSNRPDSSKSSRLSELGVNYIIDGHNLRLNANFTSGDASASGYAGRDNKAFSFGVQFQI